GKVKIFYHYNMNTDPDRELEFNIDAGATGRCWAEQRIQVVDLAEVREKARQEPDYLERHWKFRPQDQAAVRQTLQALLSVPIFDPRDYDPKNNSGTLMGVLNFDSDNSVEEIGFRTQGVVEIARRFAEAIAHILVA